MNSKAEILPINEKDNTSIVADDEIKEEILRYPLHRIPYQEWSMCTFAEAQERALCNELSMFECLSNSKGEPIRKKPDSFRCVKKYRRSAAGGGITKNDLHQRNLHEIEISVWYLLGGVFTKQRPPNRAQYLHHKVNHEHSPSEKEFQLELLNCTDDPIINNSNHTTTTIHQHSLCNTVKFIDDRIRAIQVDLTKLLGNEKFNKLQNNYKRIRRLQAMIVRYHLLSQYLLFGNNRTDKNLDFEWTFALSALRTSLSAYLETWSVQYCIIENANNEIQEQDEVLSYVVLLHIAAVTRCREMAVELIPLSSDRPCGLFLDEGNGINALLSFIRKYVPNQAELKNYRKLRWALKLASSIEEGNFITALRMLTQDDDKHDCKYLEPLSCLYHPGLEQTMVSKLKLPLNRTWRWKILARCCLAQNLPFLYLSSLRQYNKAFMKEEKVSINNVGKLFCSSESSILISFCKAFGLPMLTRNDSELFISMKTAVISLQTPEAVGYLKSPCRTSFLDPFVFGVMTNCWLQTNSDCYHYYPNHKHSEIANSNYETLDWGNFHTRIDENGIHIPPSSILWELIR